MARRQTVINLDPIDRKKKLGLIGRLLITRYAGGRKPHKTYKFGHYIFCGKQRSGKTASAIWYAENRRRYHRKRRLSYMSQNILKEYTEPPVVKLYSNIGIGKAINKQTLAETIDRLDPNANEIRIFIIDEVHGYFPRGSVNKDNKKMIDDLLVIFSQLAKRNTYIFSTAQVYGRLDKALREQCLYMVNCKIGLTGKFINDFIDGDDIIADDLGRWAGQPEFIYKHGLAKSSYDTKKLIRD